MSDPNLILTHTSYTVDFWANNGDHRMAILWLPDEVAFRVDAEQIDELKTELRKMLIERDAPNGAEMVAAEVASISIEIHRQRRPSILDQIQEAIVSLAQMRRGNNNGHHVQPTAEETLAKFDRRDFGMVPSLPLIALVVHSRITDHNLPEFMTEALKDMVSDYEHNPDKPLCGCGQDDCVVGQIEKTLCAYATAFDNAYTQTWF